MKASAQLKSNIDELLRKRGQTRKDLALWCHKSESWISQIFREPRGADGLVRPERGLPLKYLDRIADFFGLHAYQLFQPGISPLTERRAGERRLGRERRKLARAGDVSRPRGSALWDEIRALDDADQALVRGLVSDLRSHAGGTRAHARDSQGTPADTGTTPQRTRRKHRA
jgi:hypothetical protein